MPYDTPDIQQMLEQGMVKEQTNPDEIKKAIWMAEASMRDIPNKYQFTAPGLSQAKQMDKSLASVTIKDIERDKTIEEKAYQANIAYLNKYVLDDAHRSVMDYVQAWYLPFGYKKAGYDRTKVSAGQHFDTMKKREFNVTGGKGGK